MSLSWFPTNHKNWYWFLVFTVNLLLPFSITLFRRLGERGDFGEMDPFLHWTLPLSFLFALFMAFTLSYIWATLREHRACLRIMRRRLKGHFNVFIVGISCTWAALFLFFVTIIYNRFNWSNQTCRISTYALAGITMILGLVSNICLNMFEFRMGFDVFRHRYAKTLMVEIRESMENRKLRIGRRKNKKNVE